MRELNRENGLRRKHFLISFPCDYFKLLHFLAENILKFDFLCVWVSFSFFFLCFLSCVCPVELNGVSDSYCASL